MQASIQEEFARDLALWRVRYRHDPRGETVHLCMLSLEREQMVSTAYRDSALLTRLRALDVPPDVRDIMRHALLWTWKDEEMHAIYVRGVIVKLGRRRIRLQALAQQIGGALAGWATSVRQHVRDGEAPLARAAAAAVVCLGRLAGKVPNTVRGHLQFRSFREFCIFNVEAEATAAACWGRLVELARASIGAVEADDFARILHDEENHTIVFQALADALDPHDRLVAGVTAESLAARIAQAGEFFLPRRLRVMADNPLGSGAPVHVVEGRSLHEKQACFEALLAQSGLEARLQARARVLGRPVRVAIKPTFMLGYHRKDPSNITDPALLKALARWLRVRGIEDVALIEAPNIYDQFYAHRSVPEVAAYFDIVSDDWRLVDAAAEQTPHAFHRGLAQYSVARSWKEADFRIVFGKMRSHPVEQVFLTLGTLEGLGERSDRFLFFERQAQRETAAVTLMSDFPPHFALLDAYAMAPDNILGVMGCPHPRVPLRLYGGEDAIALDRVAARHMGLHDASKSRLIALATQWFGTSDGPVLGCDTPIADWRGPYHNDLCVLLSVLAWPMYVFASFRGALFVPEMDECAFPPLRPTPAWMRLARATLRTLLGLRFSR